MTLDGDFADLSALLGSPPKIGWLRCGNKPTAHIAALIRIQADAIFALTQADHDCLELW